MNYVGELSELELTELLCDDGLPFRVGPYAYHLRSSLSVIRDGLLALYAGFPLLSRDDFIDYNVSMDYCGLRSRLERKVEFAFDYQRAFGPLPVKQAYAFLEWGMNWCVSIHANEYLKLHAGVVAKSGGAIVMPGIPGAGKSTLCAALALSGWRILSDEHALIPPGSTEVVPLCRPISLKNESIDIIRAFDRNTVFGPVTEDTHKGVVAHIKADLHPASHCTDALPIRYMVFPRYSASESQVLALRPRSRSFILAAYHSFNYSLLGARGFNSMVKLMDAVECYDLVYRDLDWALKSMEDLDNGST